MYAQDATEQEEEGEEEGEGEGEGGQREWIKVLTAECRDLRESNLQLTAEVGEGRRRRRQRGARKGGMN